MKRTAAVSEEANRRRESWQVYGCQEAEVASDPASSAQETRVR